MLYVDGLCGGISNTHGLEAVVRFWWVSITMAELPHPRPVLPRSVTHCELRSAKMYEDELSEDYTDLATITPWLFYSNSSGSSVFL